jgi:hypothetical protein
LGPGEKKAEWKRRLLRFFPSRKRGEKKGDGSMNDSVPTEIAPLTQVTFTLRAETADGEAGSGLGAGPVPETLPQSLIVGLLSSGMTPFEHLLLGKSPGETVAAALTRADLADFFGPLPVTPPPLPEDSGTFSLAVNIMKLQRPDAREMIRAMAALAEGCGGSCGCGCGGH